MRTKIENNSDYFCDSAHTTSGRPKMEDILMDYAKVRVFHKIVHGSDFSNLVSEIENEQQRQKQLNGRLKECCISLYGGHEDGIVWLAIGQNHLCFQKVMGEY